MKLAIVICRKLLEQLTCWAFNFAPDRAGKSIAARIAIIAMTTSSSISVKAQVRLVPGKGVRFNWVIEIQFPYCPRAIARRLRWIGDASQFILIRCISRNERPNSPIEQLLRRRRIPSLAAADQFSLLKYE